MKWVSSLVANIASTTLSGVGAWGRFQVQGRFPSPPRPIVFEPLVPTGVLTS